MNGEISCFNQNTAGLLLYKKFGFEPFDIEERKDPNGQRTALIHMRHKVAKT
jgi:ribosomal protein S18 acetylase RimI-like enzyme